jgi:hypothetical protein
MASEVTVSFLQRLKMVANKKPSEFSPKCLPNVVMDGVYSSSTFANHAPVSEGNLFKSGLRPALPLYP